jgi:hypothetical protein
MPGLLSGSRLRTGGSGQFISLPNAMPQLPTTPTTSTGYTLITSNTLVTTYASSLGNIQFANGQMYSNATTTNLQLVGTGTLSVIVSGGTTATNTSSGALVVQGGLGVWDNSYFGGSLTAKSALVTDLTPASGTGTGALAVLGGASIGENLYVLSTGTFKWDVTVDRDLVAYGQLNAYGGSVNLNPVAASVTIEPTLGGTVTIQPSLTGHINDMIIGEYYPRDAHFLNSYADNFIGLATTATNINSGKTGSIPYQLSENTTAFIDIGPAGSVLYSNGTTATWTAAVSVSTATDALNVFINTSTADTIYGVILSTGTNAFSSVEEDPNLLYDTTAGTLSTPNLTVSNSATVIGSVYSQDGIAEENNLLYTPITYLSIDEPVTHRLGDFWIHPGLGVTFQYISDGTNKIWFQFGGL